MTEKAAKTQLNTNLRHYPSASAFKKKFFFSPRIGLGEEKNPLTGNGSPAWGERGLQKSGGSFYQACPATEAVGIVLASWGGEFTGPSVWDEYFFGSQMQVLT